MNVWDLPPVTWRKSGRSSEEGGMCVEVAAWRKSSHSDEQGGTCVEIAAGDRVIFVRDSKDPDGPVLAFGAAAWAAFTRAVS